MRLVRALPVLLVLACNKPAAPAPSAPPAVPAPQGPAASAPAAAPGTAPAAVAPGAVAPAGGALSAGGIRFTPPAGWTVETPSSPMRLHQLAIPGDAGPGVVTVMGAGGTVEENLNRWRKQFQGQPAEAVSNRTVNGLPVTLLTLTGTYLDKPAPMSPQPGVPREGWTMTGVVIEAPQGLIFVKGWGPSATMDGAKAAFEALVSSIARD